MCICDPILENHPFGHMVVLSDHVASDFLSVKFVWDNN